MNQELQEPSPVHKHINRFKMIHRKTGNKNAKD